LKVHKKNERGSGLFTKGTIKLMKAKQSGPYGHGRRGELGSGQIPAWEGHESKRRLGGNSEGSRAHLLVAWVGYGMTYGGGATGTGGSRRHSAMAVAFRRGVQGAAGVKSFTGRR